MNQLPSEPTHWGEKKRERAKQTERKHWHASVGESGCGSDCGAGTSSCHLLRFAHPVHTCPPIGSRGTGALSPAPATTRCRLSTSTGTRGCLLQPAQGTTGEQRRDVSSHRLPTSKGWTGPSSSKPQRGVQSFPQARSPPSIHRPLSPSREKSDLWPDREPSYDKRPPASTCTATRAGLYIAAAEWGLKKTNPGP